VNDYNRNLPPPIRPNTRASYEEEECTRGSLSDFSDYESSDEGRYEAAEQSSSFQVRTRYVHVSDNDEEEDAPRRIIGDEHEDPFADPFAD
jgi:LAS seventeen-binding protein 5